MRDGEYSDTRGVPEGRRAPARMERTATPGIFKKGSRYIVVYRDPQRRQRKRSTRTLAEARVLKAALTADVTRGEFVETTRVTFADYAADWIATYPGRTARGIRPGTLLDYRRALGLDEDGNPTGGGALDYFGRMPLTMIRPQDVKAYAAHVAARGVARNTVRLCLAPLRAMLATAFEDGVIRSNPAAGVRLGRVVASSPVKQTRALSEDEVVRVLAKIPDAYRPIVEFLAQTGVRISEALPLTTADVDFGRRRVRITRRLYGGEVDAPKSRHGVREVPLSAETARSLWTRMVRETDDVLLFPSVTGGTIDRSRLYRAVRAAGKEAGIEWPVGLHTFRHSAASIMFLRGVEKERIRQRLGHHSWEFTSSTYVHLDEGDLDDGDVLGDLVAGSAPQPILVQDAGNTGATRPAETGIDRKVSGKAVGG